MYNAQITREKIKEICKSQKINIGDMLDTCGLGINAINQINNTKGMASFSLAKIADYLNCSVDYLLGRVDTQNGTYSISGDNNLQINGNNGNNSPLTVNGNTPLDEMEKNLLNAFRSIEFSEKLKIVSDVMEKAKK